MHRIVVLALAVAANTGSIKWSEGFAREFMLQCQAKMPAQAASVCGCLSGRLDGTMPEADARTAPNTPAYHSTIADALAACAEDLPEPSRTNLEQGVEAHRKVAAELGRTNDAAGAARPPGASPTARPPQRTR